MVEGFALPLRKVNPARAGMIRIEMEFRNRAHGKPRASGDDPSQPCGRLSTVA